MKMSNPSIIIADLQDAKLRRLWDDMWVHIGKEMGKSATSCKQRVAAKNYYRNYI